VTRSPVLEHLRLLLDDFRGLDEGEVATYIPELGRADPSWFGIAVVTADGHRYAVGDTDLEFTIQSISKPFVFGMALEDRGRDPVLERVGVEPSGNPFNAIVVDDQNRPFNPMVNAGAIVATGLIGDGDGTTRMDRILETFGRYAGRSLSLDRDVYESESATGDRNRSIAWLMRSFGAIDGDVDGVIDDYFKQCSLLVNCTDLATMAATLANRGVNPVTGEQALDARFVENVLSVMSTCGMYDYAGEWVYTVGLPA
jgi:glutaminase